MIDIDYRLKSWRYYRALERMHKAKYFHKTIKWYGVARPRCLNSRTEFRRY